MERSSTAEGMNHNVMKITASCRGFFFDNVFYWRSLCIG
jgi:hypothetical protein